MPRNGKPPQLKRLRDGSMLDICDSIIAGRHSSCGINLSHEEGASRKHARFNISDDQLTITDLGSLNGTLVNGVEIDGPHALDDSDIIIFDTDKYLLSIPPMKRMAPEVSTCTSDTVIANKAERINPASITPAIRVLADKIDNHKPNNQPAEVQYENTMEYLNSLPAPDMKRPVGMPEHDNKKSRVNTLAAIFTKKWLPLLLVLIAVVLLAYLLGLRAAK